VIDAFSSDSTADATARDNSSVDLDRAAWWFFTAEKMDNAAKTTTGKNPSVVSSNNFRRSGMGVLGWVFKISRQFHWHCA